MSNKRIKAEMIYGLNAVRETKTSTIFCIHFDNLIPIKPYMYKF